MEEATPSTSGRNVDSEWHRLHTRHIEKSTATNKPGFWFNPLREGEWNLEDRFVREVYQTFKARYSARSVESKRFRREYAAKLRSDGVDGDTGESENRNSRLSDNAADQSSKPTLDYSPENDKKRKHPHQEFLDSEGVPTYECFTLALQWIRSLRCNELSFIDGPVFTRHCFSPIMLQCLALALLQHSHFYGGGVDGCPQCADPVHTTSKDPLTDKYFETRRFKNLINYQSYNQTANPGAQKFLHRESLAEMEKLRDERRNSQSRTDKSSQNSRPSSGKLRTQLDEVEGWLSLAYQSSSTFRGLDLSQHLFTCVSYISNTGHIPNLAIARIQDIFRRLTPTPSDGFPFVLTKPKHGQGMTTKFYGKSKELPVRLIYMIMSYIHKHYYFVCGAFPTKATFELGIDFIESLWYRPDSFEDGYLENKGLLDFLPPYVIGKCSLNSVQVDKSGRPVGFGEKVPPFVYKLTQKEQDILDRYPQFDQIIASHPKSTLDEVHHLITALLCAVSVPVYITTAMAIRAQRSQYTNIDHQVKEPKIVTAVGGVPLKYDASCSSFANVAQALETMGAEVESELAGMDYGVQFIKSLTTRSSGTLPLSLTESLKQEFPGKRAQKLMKKKAGLIAFASNILTDGDDWMDVAATPSSVTFRTQLHRRDRMVQMVNLAVQMSSLHLQLALKIVAAHNSEIAVGKTTGAAVDIVSLLHASGDPNILIASSDITGFDSRMTDPMKRYLRAQVAQWLGSNPKKFFFSQACSVLEDNVDTDIIRDINAVQNILLKSQGVITAPVAHDRDFDQIIALSKDTLASGEFGTTALASLILAGVVREMKRLLPTLNMTGAVAGDDMRNEFQATEDPDKAVELFTKALSDTLLTIGMTANPMISRDFGIFLQMAALKGLFMSTLYRLSLVTDERPEHTDSLHGWEKMQGLLNEMLGRSPNPDGVIQLGRVMFYAYSSINVGKARPLDPNHIYCSVTEKHYVNLPIMLYHSKSHGGNPLPNTKTSLGAVLADNTFSMRGEAVYYGHMRRILRPVDEVDEFGFVITERGREFVDQFTAHGVKKLKMFIHNSVDPMVMEEMDLFRTYAYDQYSHKKFISEKELEDPEVKELLLIGTNTYKNLQRRSYEVASVGKAFLSLSDIKVPPLIDFTEAPRRKMLDILVDSDPDGQMWIELHSSMENLFKESVKNKAKYEYGIPEPMKMFVTFPEITSFKVNWTPVADVSRHVAIAPPGICSPMHRITVMREGTTEVGSHSAMAVVNSWVGATYLEDRTEEVNYVLNQIRRKSPDQAAKALDALASVMALPPSGKRALFTIYQTGRGLNPAPIHVTNPPRANMWLNDSVKDIRVRTLKPCDSNSKQIADIIDGIAAIQQRCLAPYLGARRMKVHFPTFYPPYIMYKTKTQ